MRHEVETASEPARKQQDRRWFPRWWWTLGEQWKTAAWGEATAPASASPMLPGEMPWALLINHFLSTYYVPTILHLSLHLAFSTTLFTGKKTKAQREKRLAWNQPSLSQGSERRGSKGAVEQV